MRGQMCLGTEVAPKRISMRVRFVGMLFMLLCVSSLGQDWPQYHHDRRCTGFCPGQGDITNPTISWQHYLGAPRPVEVLGPASGPAQRQDLDADGHVEILQITDKALTVSDGQGQEIWRQSFEESGFCWARTKVGSFLKDVPGLQVVCFGAHMGTGKSTGHLFAFDQGASKGRQVWRTELKDYYSPSLVVADVDADGTLDVVTSPHYRVQVFDIQTGQLKFEIPWQTGRNYGYLGAFQLDETPELEIIVICDFVLHVDMLRVEKGAGKQVWGHRYVIENAPGARRKFLHVGPHPVTDVDGDGQREIVYNLLNDTGDEKWHVMVLNPLTGETEADLPGFFLSGIKDMDGDGSAEIIGTPTSGNRPRRLDRVEIVKIKEGTPAVWLSRENDRVPRANVSMSMPAHEATLAEDGHLAPACLDVDKDGLEELIVLEGSSSSEQTSRVAALGASPEGQPAEKWAFAVSSDVELFALSPGMEYPLVLRDMVNGDRIDVLAPGAGAKRSNEKPGGFATSPIATDVDTDDRTEIVVPTSRDTVQCLRMPEDPAKPPVLLWEVPGLAMTQSPGYLLPGRNGVVAADLNGDGKKEILVSGKGAEESACLICLDSEGQALWSHAFENCRAGGVEAGVDAWSPGQFRKDKGLDVWVGFHRHSRNSGESACLDGRTGALLWHRELVTAESPEGHQAMPAGDAMPGIADGDGDGLEEIYLASYVVCAGIEGDTGELGSPQVFMPSKDCFGQWVAYSVPVPVDFTGDGRPEIYLNSGSYARGARASMTLEGKPFWATFTQNETGSAGLQALADVNGDVIPDVGCDGLDKHILCLNGRDGSTLWQVDTTYPCTSNLAAGDVDGDGEPEFLFVDGTDLKALKGRSGALAWSLPVAGGGPPVLADVDSDGKLEILLVSADGHLKVIDQKRD